MSIASHSVLLILFSADLAIETIHLYVEIHPSFDMDLLTILDFVFFHICTTLDQTSWFWSFVAITIHSKSVLLLSHFKILQG